MNPYQEFRKQCNQEIQIQGADPQLSRATREWMTRANARNYSYHFEWLSRPIIQYPQDMVAAQELIWKVKPDLIIETGIAHGGSIIFSASILALLDLAEAMESGVQSMDPRVSKRKVLGIDIDIRTHNRAAIEAHPLSYRIQMIEGSSVAQGVIDQVYEVAQKHGRIMVFLDSMHTHDHVLAELEAYGPLVSPESYCVVFDTIIEHFPDGTFPDRPWGKGNNPKTAVQEYLRRIEKEGRMAADGAPLCFEVDKRTEDKLLITVAPGGYLFRRD